jgi:hypothetical protein
LVNFITCGCKSSAPFFVIYKAGYESGVKHQKSNRNTCIDNVLSN